MVKRRPHKSYYGETGPIVIKQSRRKFDWQKVAGRRGGQHTVGGLVSIKHHEFVKRNGTVYKTYAIYLRASLQTVFGTFRYAEIYYTENFLGLRFYEEKLETAYTLGLSSKKRFRLQAKFVSKLEQRDYEAEDLEFDTANKMLVIPIKLKKGETITQDDFRFVPTEIEVQQ